MDSAEFSQDAPILRADHLVAHARNAAGDGAPVLGNISIAVHAGETITISGPSGMGKSTLLWVLARLIPVDSGTLELRGNPSSRITPCEWRRRVSLVLQKPVLVPGTVEDNLRLPETLKTCVSHLHADADMLRQELTAVGLGEVSLARPATELSGGEAARVALLRTLLTGPDCLLLDEPAASLDSESARLITDRILAYTSQGGCAVVVRHGDWNIPGARSLRLDAGRLEAAS